MSSELDQAREQLAQKDAQLLELTSTIADQAATIKQQAARIAALEFTAAAAPPRAAPSLQHTMTQAEQSKLEHEIGFNNSLEPLLRKWMLEAPTMAAAALLADKAKVLLLEEALATPAAQAELAALVPAVAVRLRASAQPYVGDAQVQRLAAIIEAGNQLYSGIYHGVLDMVRANDGYDDFCATLDAIAPDRSRFPQRTAGGDCQPNLLAIYASAREAHPLFGAVLGEVARREGAAAGTRTTPLKHVFRVLQKHATRVDGGKPTEFETACDIVRGSIVVSSMSELLAVLRLLLVMEEEGTIIIVRTKNRFMRPTAAGWADAMLNFVCLGGSAMASRHVCELQLVHATMLKARKEFGGHQAYAAFREAAELLEFIVGGVLVDATEAPVAALEVAAGAVVAAGGGEEAAAVEAAWMAAWQAVCDTLAPLWQARALVPSGSDSAAATDVLLGRVNLAAPPRVFVETGGEWDSAELADGGRLFRTTKKPGQRCHSATAPVASSLTRIQVMEGSEVRDLYLGLASVQKSLSKRSFISRDSDVWLIYCRNGDLYAGGGCNSGAGPVRAGDVLELDYNADARILRFLRDGQVLGQHVGVASTAKLVVSMGQMGSAVRLLG
jgi:hypothetical protein